MAVSYDNWKVEDLYKLRENKANYGNTNNQAYKDVYNLNNKNIRTSYGMTDADDISIGELDRYIATAERQQTVNNQKNGLLTNLTQQATNRDAQAQKSADAVKNFVYDPNTDPAYQSYVNMYNRQGQSAAKSTLNNLNAANMGRNSSYSAAATAQVQQAYAQKASEMIPTLAEQAYNKLLQQYNIDKDMSDTQYDRQLTAYQTLADAGTRELTDEQLREQNLYNKWAHEQEYKYAPTERDQNIKLNDLTLRDTENTVKLNEKYGERERELGIQGSEAELANIYSTINNRSTSGSSGGGSSSGSSKEELKRAVDSSISHYLYSNALNPDGSGTWPGTSKYTQYYAVDKLKDADVVSNIIDSLMGAGYSYSQAKEIVEGYKKTATVQTMKIEGKQGWDDSDVVEARKNVLFR